MYLSVSKQSTAEESSSFQAGTWAHIPIHQEKTQESSPGILKAGVGEGAEESGAKTDSFLALFEKLIEKMPDKRVCDEPAAEIRLFTLFCLHLI